MFMWETRWAVMQTGPQSSACIGWENVMQLAGWCLLMAWASLPFFGKGRKVWFFGVAILTLRQFAWSWIFRQLRKWTWKLTHRDVGWALSGVHCLLSFLRIMYRWFFNRIRTVQFSLPSGVNKGSQERDGRPGSSISNQMCNLGKWF